MNRGRLSRGDASRENVCLIFIGPRAAEKQKGGFLLGVVVSINRSLLTEFLRSGTKARLSNAAAAEQKAW